MAGALSRASSVALLGVLARVLLLALKGTEMINHVESNMQPNTFVNVQCKKNQRNQRPVVPKCSTQANKKCGAFLVDNFINVTEVNQLRNLVHRAMKLGGGSGGPTILDLQSGALSKGDKFIDIWRAFDLAGVEPLTKGDVSIYAQVVDRVAERVAAEFGARGLHLTAPTFFSRISADLSPVTENDEYWHSHIDTEQYEAFDYTTLLYLSDTDSDFGGGRLVLDTSGDGLRKTIISPRRGRLLAFSSGPGYLSPRHHRSFDDCAISHYYSFIAEFPHYVEKVSSGTRLALTIAFTCTRAAAIHKFLDRAAPDKPGQVS